MLSFLTAEEASMEAFLSVSAASPYQPQLREYAHSLLEQRCTRPDWCLLGLAADVPVARAALWALPNEAVPSDVVLIEANWTEPGLAGGHALLNRTHELAARLGARELQHHVDSPPGRPQYQEHESDRIRLLTDAGYELQRDGLRWLYTTSAAVEPPPESSLVFRGLSEVGEAVFVEALALTYTGTRDSMLTRHIQRRGLLEAARSDFRDYQQMEYLPEWWELAYTEDGALAGVIMAGRIPSSAVIGHVGVVPEQRGRGFAVQLVRRGTQQLVAGGASEIRGDCDRDNVAMVKAFRRAGYEQTTRRRTYQCRLPV
jgi:ribosomal protein S18 acetylase RimI-like enzyme